MSNLGVDDTSELLEKNFALSLSDRYWVRPAGSDLHWAHVNFFDNDFTDELGRLTLSPSDSQSGLALDDGDLMSPNSSVLGNVPKKWVIWDGERWLVKAATRSFGQDVFNEAVACALYSRLMEPGEYVSYRLVESANGETFCACPNMLGPDEELVAASDLLRKHRGDRDYGSYPCVLRALGESGLDEGYLAGRMSKLFSCDFLMANADRHTGNFGLIRNARTLEYTGFAPTFDTGFSLWCDKWRLHHPSDYLYRPRPFVGRPSESPEQQLRLFDDYRWFPLDADLERWIDQAGQILSSDPLLAEARVEAIVAGMRQNVAMLERHVGRMSRLFPDHAPKSAPQI